MFLPFFYIASMYVCCASHDTYGESHETTFVSMPAKPVPFWPKCSRLAFHSTPQNYHHPGSGLRPRPDSSSPVGGNIVTQSHWGAVKAWHPP